MDKAKRLQKEVGTEAEDLAAHMARLFYSKSAVAVAMAIRVHEEIMREMHPNCFEMADKFLNKGK